jgi:hemoglobin
MKQDIQSRTDIELLIIKFYEKAMIDEVIGFYFTEVVPLNLEKHIPVIVNFWESVLLGNNVYHGDPIKPHYVMHSIHAFTDAHFARWVMLFTQTVDESFEGDIAERAKQRALSIATVMRIKIIHNTNTQFLK